MQESPVQSRESERTFAVSAERYSALFRIHWVTPRARNLIDLKYRQADPSISVATIDKRPAAGSERRRNRMCYRKDCSPGSPV
jgi:hypothetical protein